MIDFEGININVNDDVRSEMKIIWIDLKIIVVHVIDDVADEMSDEVTFNEKAAFDARAAFDIKVAFDVNDKTDDLNFFAWCFWIYL